MLNACGFYLVTIIDYENTTNNRPNDYLLCKQIVEHQIYSTFINYMFFYLWCFFLLSNYINNHLPNWNYPSHMEHAGERESESKKHIPRLFHRFAIKTFNKLAGRPNGIRRKNTHKTHIPPPIYSKPFGQQRGNGRSGKFDGPNKKRRLNFDAKKHIRRP